MDSIPEVSPGFSRRKRTLLDNVIHQLKKNKTVLGPSIFIIMLLIVAIFADSLNSLSLQGYGKVLEKDTSCHIHPYYIGDVKLRPGESSRSRHLEGFVYWLGTDNLGRDIWNRVLCGVRISILVAIGTATVSLSLGLSYGLIAGYAGGWIDYLMMGLIDLLSRWPLLILVIVLKVYLEDLLRYQRLQGLVALVWRINQSTGGLLLVILMMAAISWLSVARIAREETRRVKEQEYVQAARLVGMAPSGIIMKQILPNILGLCMAHEAFQIPQYLLFEAFLSFIGVGVDPPTPSWGLMIRESHFNPHIMLWPSLALILIVMAFIFLAEGLWNKLATSVWKYGLHSHQLFIFRRN